MSDTKKPAMNTNPVKPTMEMQTINLTGDIAQNQTNKPVMQMQNAIKSMTPNKSGK